jgi:AcrR family transcriptional regulator
VMATSAATESRVPLSRARICDAARGQIEAVGLAGLSLREVARSLGVSAAALYAHVDGKRGLVAAVAEEAFEGLGARFAAIHTVDPIDHLRAQSHAYVEYALEAPNLYEVMMSFEPQLPGLAPHEARDEIQLERATAVFGEAMRAVTAAVDADLLVLDDPTLVALILWASVHGLVGSLTSGLDIPAAVRDRFVDTAIETTIRGLVRVDSTGRR